MPLPARRFQAVRRERNEPQTPRRRGRHHRRARQGRPGPRQDPSRPARRLPRGKPPLERPREPHPAPRGAERVRRVPDRRPRRSHRRRAVADLRPRASRPRVEFGRYRARPGVGWARCPTRSSRSPRPADPPRARRARACTPSSTSPTTRRPASMPARSRSGRATRRSTIDVTLTVWDFTLPDHLSFLPEMNCYDLPRRRAVVLPARPRAPDGPQPRALLPPRERRRRLRAEVGRQDARLGRLGPPVRAAARRLGLRRPAAQGRAARMLLPADARELADADGGQLQRQLLGRRGASTTGIAGPSSRSRGSSPSTPTRRAGTTRSSSASSTARSTSSATAGRAGRAPGCSTSRRTSRTYWALRYFGRAFHEGVSRAPGRAKLVFRADISRPEWQRDVARRPARLQRGRRGASAAIGGSSSTARRRKGRSSSSTAAPTRSRTRTCSPSAGRSTSGRSASTASSPGRRSATPSRGRRPTPLSLFYPPRPGDKGPVPSVRLKAFRRGQQDVEYLTLYAHRHGRAALGGRASGSARRWAWRPSARAPARAARTRASCTTAGSAPATSGPSAPASARPSPR